MSEEASESVTSFKVHILEHTETSVIVLDHQYETERSNVSPNAHFSHNGNSSSTRFVSLVNIDHHHQLHHRRRRRRRCRLADIPWPSVL